MEPTPSPGLPKLSPEHYYMDGPYMVFTAAFHLKRGYCCGSGCRHCPYKEGTPGGEQAANADHLR